MTHHDLFRNVGSSVKELSAFLYCFPLSLQEVKNSPPPPIDDPSWFFFGLRRLLIGSFFLQTECRAFHFNFFQNSWPFVFLLFIVVIMLYLDSSWLHLSFVLLSRPMMGHDTLIWASNACYYSLVNLSVPLFVYFLRPIYNSHGVSSVEFNILGGISWFVGGISWFVGKHDLLDRAVAGVIEGSPSNVSSASTRWVQISVSAASSSLIRMCIPN